jgi:hypothetical protein
LTPKNVTTVYHTPDSPDLSLPDYFLFPELKISLKGLMFADVAEFKEDVEDELKNVRKEEVSENARPCKSLYICQWSLF